MWGMWLTCVYPNHKLGIDGPTDRKSVMTDCDMLDMLSLRWKKLGSIIITNELWYSGDASLEIINHRGSCIHLAGPASRPPRWSQLHPYRIKSLHGIINHGLMIMFLRKRSLTSHPQQESPRWTMRARWEPRVGCLAVESRNKTELKCQTTRALLSRVL